MREESVSRRGFLGKCAAAGAATLLGPAALADAKKKRRRGKGAPHPPTPDAALKALLKGNRRYRKGKLELRDYSPVGEERASKQQPFAALITCADSRVSPTLVFDLERGNIFVSKVAGNVIDAGTLGSTEYAVKVLGVKLVMVLGHSDCGAVRAGVGVANGTAGYPRDTYGEIGAVIDRLVPPISALPPDRRTVENSIAVNAKAQAAEIAGRGPIIQPAIATEQLKVVAAVYDIPSGKVNLV